MTESQLDHLQATLERYRTRFPADDDLFRCAGAVAWARFGKPKADIEFALAGRHCYVDGERVQSSSKGLLLAWLVITGRQHGIDDLRVEWVFPGEGGHRALRNVIKLAARDVERISPVLAGVILRIGTQRGLIAVKGSTRGVVCTSSWLAALCRDIGVTSTPSHPYPQTIGATQQKGPSA